MRRILFLPALLVCALVVMLAPLAAAQEDEEPTPTGDHEQVVDITFPTDPRATFTDDYATARSRGDHGATDLMGEKMWPVYAAVGGTVTFIPGADEGEAKPHYGYMIRIEGDDGRRYSYVHLNDDTPGTSDDSAGPEHAYASGLRKGSVVERGQFIGWMGDSGNATGNPHLHFEIADEDVVDPQGTDRINPYNSLKDALRRGDVASGDDVPAGSDVDRVSGLERVATAVALSRSAFDRADTVVIASAGSFPDSIVAGPLAAALDAPVLTTYGEELEDRVVEEVRRLGATEAYLVGPSDRLSTAIGDALIERTDVTWEGLSRLTGADDFATAATVAKKVRGLTGSSEALVALGAHPDEKRAWPDALSAGYHGAVTGHPVLLVAHDDVPQVTLDALAEVDRATIIGGTAAVSDESEAAIAEVAPSVRRLAGPDRFSTSGVVADDLLDDGLVDAERVWAATGHAYADALAAASAVAASAEVLLMIDGSGDDGDAGLDAWFSRRSSGIATARVIGGEAAVSGRAVDRLAQRIR